MNKIKITDFEPLEYTRNEEFNSLHVNLDFSGKDIKVIGITSSTENEGKSFITMELMRTYAKDGRKVLFIDSDLRKSRLEKRYKMKSDFPIRGLTHYLAGMANIDDIIYETDIPNAYIIVAGKVVSNSTALLMNDSYSELFKFARENFDVILIDTPPIMPVIDGAYISKYCDGMLIAVNYGQISRYEVQDTKKQLEVAGANILGVVLNKVPFNANKSYYKSYSKYYKYKYYKNYYAPTSEK